MILKMQTDVLDYNSIEDIMTADIVHSDVLLALQNEIQNMNLGIKINVQLLSRKNMLQFKRYLKELASLIQDRLSDAGKEVTERELYDLIERILFPILQTENEHLFYLEYNILNNTNDYLKRRLEQTLYEKSYQDCLLAMNEIIEQFRVGIHNTNYVIDLEKKMDSLNYELAVTYKLHSSIELYMDIKKLVEEYKVAFHEIYLSSLKQLQADNFDNAIKVKDSVIHRMQEHKYKEYDDEKNKRTIS